MQTNYTNEQRYIKAKKRVDNIKGFYGNALSYCLVIPFLIFINLKFSPQFHWFWFPVIGWGIGLAFHAFGVFGTSYLFGKNWEERKIKEFMDNDKL